MSARIRAAAALGAILALAVGLRLACFVGIQLSDDMNYLVAAAHWAREGTPPDWNLYNARLGLVLPMALGVKLLGVGDAGGVAFNFLCSIGLVATAFWLGRRLWGLREGVVAGLLVALLPQDTLYATSAYPDMPLALFVTLGTGLVLLELRKPREARRAGPFLAAGLLVGLAHLQRETAFLALPAIFVLALLRGRRDLRIAWVAAGFALVVAAECGFFAAVEGDWLYRLRLPTQGVADIVTATHFRGEGAIARRVLQEYPSLMFNPMDTTFLQFGLLFYAALAGGVWATVRRRPEVASLAVWALVFVAVCDVFPSRLSPYTPALTAIPRYLHPLAVPLSLLAAVGIVSPTPRWGLAARGGALAAVLAAALLAAPRLAFDARLWTLGLDDLHAWWVSAGRPQPVWSDARTVRRFEFREGFPDRSLLRPYEGPPRDGIVLRNERMLRHGREYYGKEPPPGLWEPPAEWVPLYHAEVPGRPSLRARLLGRGGGALTVNRLTAYRVPP